MLSGAMNSHSQHPLQPSLVHLPRNRQNFIQWNILSWNVRGISSKLKHMRDLMLLNEEIIRKPEIIALQETFITSSNVGSNLNNVISIPGYTSYTCNRSKLTEHKKCGGGSAMLLRADIISKYTVDRLTCNTPNCVWIRIKIPQHGYVHFISLYLPPYTVATFDVATATAATLEGDIRTLTNKLTEPVVLMGDFNVQLSVLNLTSPARIFLYMFRAVNIIPLSNLVNTRVDKRSGTGSIIDYVCISTQLHAYMNPVTVISSLHIGKKPSDHNMLLTHLTILSTCVSDSPASQLHCLELTSRCPVIPSVRHTLLQHDEYKSIYVSNLGFSADSCFNEFNMLHSANDNYKQVVACIYSAVDKSIGRYKYIKPDAPPYFNNRAHVMVSARQAAWTAYTRNPSDSSLFEAYTTIQTRVRGELRALADKYTCQQIHRICHTDNINDRDTWRYLCSQIQPTLTSSHDILPDARVWATYFRQLYNANVSPGTYDEVFRNTVHSEMERIDHHIRHNKTYCSKHLDDRYASMLHDLNKQITLEEVLFAIKKQGTYKHPGADGIHPTLLKADPNITAKLLLPLFQQMWEGLDVSEDMFKAVLVPLFKGKDGDPLNMSDYRAICFGSIIGRLFERIMYERLYPCAEQNRWLSDSQAGFRRGRSCAHQLFILRTVLAHRHKNNQCTYVAFVDLSKAFDKVWRNGLYYSLHNLGVCGTFLAVLQRMYSKATYSVLRNNTLSDSFGTDTGVLQGAILSPLLFCIYIECMVRAINRVGLPVHVSLLVLDELLFADDIFVVADSAEQLQLKLDAMYKAACKWRLQLNTGKGKTEVMVFGAGCAQKVWTIGSQNIHRTKQYKYLGVIITDNMSWTSHIGSRCMYAEYTMARLATAHLIKSNIPCAYMSAIYKTVVQSRLLYGTEVIALWDICDSARKYLRKMHATHAKRILNVPVWSPTTAVLSAIGWYPIEYEMGRRALSLAASMSVSSNIGSLLTNAMNDNEYGSHV